MNTPEERIFKVAYNNAYKNVDYQKHFSKAVETGYIIIERLGSNSPLFSEYENSINLAEAIALEEAYKTGVKDGVKSKSVYRFVNSLSITLFVFLIIFMILR